MLGAWSATGEKNSIESRSTQSCASELRPAEANAADDSETEAERLYSTRSRRHILRTDKCRCLAASRLASRFCRSSRVCSSTAQCRTCTRPLPPPITPIPQFIQRAAVSRGADGCNLTICALAGIRLSKGRPFGDDPTSAPSAGFPGAAGPHALRDVPALVSEPRELFRTDDRAALARAFSSFEGPGPSSAHKKVKFLVTAVRRRNPLSSARVCSRFNPKVGFLAPAAAGLHHAVDLDDLFSQLAPSALRLPRLPG